MVINDAIINFPMNIPAGSEELADVKIGRMIDLSGEYDQLRNCKITGGRIVSDQILKRPPPWFVGCVITTGKTFKILGGKPPKPCSLISDCIIEQDQLPDGYYSNCLIRVKDGAFPGVRGWYETNMIAAEE